MSQICSNVDFFGNLVRCHLCRHSLPHPRSAPGYILLCKRNRSNSVAVIQASVVSESQQFSTLEILTLATLLLFQHALSQ